MAAARSAASARSAGVPASVTADSVARTSSRSAMLCATPMTRSAVASRIVRSWTSIATATVADSAARVTTEGSTSNSNRTARGRSGDAIVHHSSSVARRVSV
ncbi:hypothetical protein ACIGEP_13690 [Microbacterium sp. NPDC077663]|uniref:hypothetical protein n=1 Tax=Microbacterium sp. NPDC077663 TaxID=3364189 RepID=UPI0037C88EE3